MERTSWSRCLSNFRQRIQEPSGSLWRVGHIKAESYSSNYQVSTQTNELFVEQ